MIINIREVQVQLLAERAIFICKQKILVIADMHLGKLVHFRKKGLFVPSPPVNSDLQTLISLIKRFDPHEVVFLGDLFHSENNSEYRSFISTIQMFQDIQFTLTKGNHDIIADEIFINDNIAVVEEKKLENNIILTHQLPKHVNESSFYIVGHIHPGYRIQGRGRQSYRLPCFHQTNNVLTLPAFGTHTGLFIPDIVSTDVVYVIMNDDVVKIPSKSLT